MSNERHFPWLLILVVAAIDVLVIELLPLSGRDLLWLLDMRNWSRSTWFFANALIVVVLVGIRYGPDVQRARAARGEQLHQAMDNEVRSESKL